MIILGCFIWLIAKLVEISVMNSLLKLWLNKIEYSMAVFLPVLWVIFTLQYVDMKKWITFKNILIVLAIPFITVLLAFTNEFHGLIWKIKDSGSVESFMIFTRDFGAWSWFFMGYMYLILLTCGLLIRRRIYNYFYIFRWQKGFLAFCLFMPIIFNILHMTEVSPFGFFDITPVAILISIFIAIPFLSRFRMGEIMPFTQGIIFESMNDGVVLVDNSRRIISINPVMEKIFKTSKGQIAGTQLQNTFPELDDYIKKNGDAGNGNKEIAVSNNGDSRNYDIKISSILLRKNKSMGNLVVLRDITDRKKAEKRIKYLSFHDYLTGLYNRAYFEEELKRLDTRRQLPISIVIGDVNGLKLINDAFGHERGDILLRKIAKILRDCFRDEDIIARWGGDEFIIFLPSTSMKDTLKIISRIKNICRNNSTKTVPLSISLGAATKTKADQDIKKVLKEAENIMYRHKLVEDQSARSSIISSLEEALRERDYETEEHVQRIRKHALAMGRELNLSDDQLDQLALLATLHDIGKIAIPDNIFLKPATLTRDERKIIERHSEVGYRIARTSHELQVIADSISAHHEWWNGSGYPNGLKGTEIPLIARIVSVVDAYDAMTNDRPYKKAISKEQAIEELLECSGKQFDPYLVEKFLGIIDRKKAYCKK